MEHNLQNYLTRLYILINVIYEFNMMDDDEIKMYYNEFYEESFLFKKFLDNKKENFLDRFEEICWVNYRF